LIAEGEDVLDGVGILRNSTCVFRNTEPNLVSFYNDQQITEEVVEFPPGSLLVSFVKEKNLEDNEISLSKSVEPSSLSFGMLDLGTALKCDKLKSERHRLFVILVHIQLILFS
jgi:hypothetical protein